MKCKNLFLFFLALLFTSGLYSFIWLYQISDDLEKNHNFDGKGVVSKKLAGLFVFLFLAVIVFSGYFSDAVRGGQVSTTEFVVLKYVMAALAFIVVVCLLNNMIVVNNFLRNNIGLNTLSNIMVVPLFFLFYISPIVIQNKVNIANRKSQRSL